MAQFETEVILERSDYKVDDLVRGVLRVHSKAEQQCSYLRVQISLRAEGVGRISSIFLSELMMDNEDFDWKIDTYDYPFELPLNGSYDDYQSENFRVFHDVVTTVYVSFTNSEVKHTELKVTGFNETKLFPHIQRSTLDFDFRPEFIKAFGDIKARTRRELRSLTDVDRAALGQGDFLLRSNVLGKFALALVGFSVVSAGVVRALKLDQGPSLLTPLAFCIGFTALTLGIYVFASRHKFTQFFFGDVQLKLGSGLIIRGGKTIHAELALQQQVSVAHAEARLICTEAILISQKKGPRRRKVIDTLYSQSVDLLSNESTTANGQRCLRFQFDVPEAATPNLSLMDHEISWHIEVDMEASGRPNWKFNIPLLCMPKSVYDYVQSTSC